MKIHDCFIFNDELDLLELRLMELGDLVDHFVLVESVYTFQQDAKPLNYGQNHKRLFSKWSDKITRVVADIKPGPHPVIEHEQRRQIARGLNGAEMTDILLIGDVDEIPSRDVLESIRKQPMNRPLVLKQLLYYYRVRNNAGYWNGTVVMPRGLGKIDFQRIRDTRNMLPHYPVDVGGWHFSWFGDVDDVRKKLACIDVVRDNDLYDSKLPDIPDPHDPSVERRVLIGDDLFGRDRSFTTQRIVPGVFQPSCVNEWLDGKEKYA